MTRRSARSRPRSQTIASKCFGRIASAIPSRHDGGLRIAADEGLIPFEAGSATPETVRSFELKNIIKTDQQQTDWWRIQFTCINTYNGRNWRQMQGGQVFYSGDAGQAVLEDPDYQTATREFWTALKTFRGPVHVIIGTHDYVDLGPTMWPWIVAHLPHAQLHTITHAGHSIWMDEPDLFTRALRLSLDETKRQDAISTAR